MKCLPAAKLPEVKGFALHDWHAEIVAIRAFNHLLLEEARALASGNGSDLLVRRDVNEQPGDGRAGQPFAIKNTINLYMYCSEAPCVYCPVSW
jgi:tRNA-specific adenosine deaminase 1